MNERRTELAVALVPLALAALTVVLVTTPQIAPAVLNEQLQLLINATATLVAVAVAVLAWVHFRASGDPATLLRGSAFLVLAALNGLLVLVSAIGIKPAFGLALEDPGQLPAWVTLVALGVAAALFVLAAAATLRGWRADRWPAALVLWLPSLLVTALAVGAATVQSHLPLLVNPAGLAILRDHPLQPLMAAAGPFQVGSQAVIGAAFLLAAGLRYAVFRRSRHGADAFLTIGLVFAAFSQVLFAVHPGTYGSLVTAGDLLRLAFYAVVLVALAAETSRDVQDLQTANVDLVRLRDADMARATAEERARLAREIHDGLSQVLWLARLKQGRLLQEPDLSAGMRSLAGEVSGAIEAAMAEARQAIVALRPSESGMFAEVLERSVADFSDRFGIPAECSCDAAGDRLAPNTQAELLRITQEALANARKHADATRVRVQVEATPSGLRLTVADNGRGFEPSASGSTGYGLRSMRERAEVIGASLMVESEPQGGTRVMVDVPIESSTP
jgi:signal transduction histidine kinase